MADAAGRTQWQSTNLDEAGGRYMILLLPLPLPLLLLLLPLLLLPLLLLLPSLNHLTLV